MLFKTMPAATDDVLHLGAKDVAKRVFGNADPLSVRRIYHLHRMAVGRRPAFLIEIGGRPACWESAIRAHAANSQKGDAA